MKMQAFVLAAIAIYALFDSGRVARIVEHIFRVFSMPVAKFMKAVNEKYDDTKIYKVRKIYIQIFAVIHLIWAILVIVSTE